MVGPTVPPTAWVFIPFSDLIFFVDIPNRTDQILHSLSYMQHSTNFEYRNVRQICETENFWDSHVEMGAGFCWIRRLFPVSVHKFFKNV